MPWELLDHQADVGLQSTGDSLSQALRDGVLGMLELMVDPASVAPEDEFPVSASGTDPGSLFVDLLNAVLAVKDINGVFLHDITIDTLNEHNGAWTLTATLTGEAFDLERHVVDSDVKAATYGGLLARESEDGWLLRCVLDL